MFFFFFGSFGTKVFAHAKFWHSWCMFALVLLYAKYNNEMADCFMAKAKKICHDFYRGAQKLVPDVLVMGSHGYSLIERLVIGEMWQGVSYHYAQNVECTVLVMRRPTSSRNN
ncbi:hypothetical protein ACJRO7_011027 [Eucalyptus globulus]|uniref:UspA domain-containing protein n=1 Tax=Eucalyptus globulus TaxID=34317 RepID=A0ABD3LNQ9_EUCGL